MSDVTHILSQIESGDPSAAEQLLPLVYEELRKLAAARLAQEKPGQTLQATALVHEAYLRLIGNGESFFNPRFDIDNNVLLAPTFNILLIFRRTSCLARHASDLHSHLIKILACRDV